MEAPLENTDFQSPEFHERALLSSRYIRTREQEMEIGTAVWIKNKRYRNPESDDLWIATKIVKKVEDLLAITIVKK